jgi:putative copper export protein
MHAELNEKIVLWHGDITSLNCDAIVNAANSGLWAGGLYFLLSCCICLESLARKNDRECASIMRFRCTFVYVCTSLIVCLTKVIYRHFDEFVSIAR